MQVRLLLRRAAQLPLTVTLTALLVVAVLDYAALPVGTRARVVEWASTNVHRLFTQPFGPMLASPFVVLDRPAVWIGLTALGIGLVEHRLGWWRTLGIVFGGHVVGTVISEGVVAWREGHGSLPASALHQIDVGVSYVAVAALAAAVVVARPAWLKPLPAVALGVCAPGLLVGLGALDVAAVGHVTAFWFGGIAGWVSVVGEHRRLRNHLRRSMRTKK